MVQWLSLPIFSYVFAQNIKNNLKKWASLELKRPKNLTLNNHVQKFQCFIEFQNVAKLENLYMIYFYQTNGILSFEKFFKG